MSTAQKLTILRDGALISELEISHEVSLGRDSGNVIHLNDRAVSRKHAVLQPVSDGLQLVRKSRFGEMRVNGENCTSAVLKTGDILQIGPYQIKVGQKEKLEPKFDDRPIESTVPEKVFEPEELEKPQMAETQELPLSEADFSLDNGLSSEVVEGPLEGAGAVPNISIDPPASEEAPLQIDNSASKVEDVGSSTESNAIENFSIGDPVPGGAEPSASEIKMDSAGAFDSASDGKTRLTSVGSLKVLLKFKPGTASVLEYEMSGAEAYLGRSSECDVVINDKRASRRHAVIRRKGVLLEIQDLKSANGTLVDGEVITERSLEGNHKIQIGDVEFELSATQADFEEKAVEYQQASESMDAEEDALSSVPSLPGLDSTTGGSSDGRVNDPAVSLAGLNSQALGAQVAAQEPKGVLAKYRSLPKRKQWIYTLILIAIGVELFWDEEIKPVISKKSAMSKKPESKSAPGVEGLSAEKLKFIESKYQAAFASYQAHKFDDCLSDLTKIFTIVDDYKNAREIERYAQQGKRLLEAQAEEKRKREEEEQRKTRIEALLTSVQRFMDQKEYAKARDLFAEILSLDPENTLVPRWQAVIEKFFEDERKREEFRRLESERRAKAAVIFDEAISKRQRGDHWGAIEDFERIEALELTDKRFMANVEREIQETLKRIDELLKPALEQAKALESSGDMAGAYKMYEKAAEIHPGATESFEGMERIRGILHEKAKVLYVEAVLAESYSDFDAAKRKLRECHAIAPKEDEYYEKSKQKLRKYDLLEQRLPASQLTESAESSSAIDNGDTVAE